jgi:hypothetical protein
MRKKILKKKRGDCFMVTLCSHFDGLSGFGIIGEAPHNFQLIPLVNDLNLNPISKVFGRARLVSNNSRDHRE